MSQPEEKKVFVLEELSQLEKLKRVRAAFYDGQKATHTANEKNARYNRMLTEYCEEFGLEPTEVNFRADIARMEKGK